MPPELIFAADESFLSKDHHQHKRVIGRAEARLQHQVGGEDREHITILPTICADGTFLPPFIIFKGARLQQDRQNNNVLKAVFAVSPNGWIDNELALFWLKEVFDKETWAKANSRTRVLFLDGHGSHLSILFIQYTREHGIVVICYLPHTTHLLQGLNVVAFAQLKSVYSRKAEEFTEEHSLDGIRKVDFSSLLGTSMVEAFTKDTVMACFSVTGISPYNPNTIDKKKLRPAKATSLHATFPIEQPSPVCHIMAAFGHPITA